MPTDRDHPARPSDTAAGSVDSLADDFEREWREGRRPSLEAYLGRAATPERVPLARELVRLDLEYRLRGGEPARAEDYLSRHPELEAGELQTFERRVRAGLGPSPWPVVPAYEILGELGRGGMGIVYMARQEGLSRVVALKRIHPGAVGDEERSRFRREAEAAARLSNPGIVQVYEVGEHDGSPYMALEYCAGGNLAKALEGSPLRPRDAAKLVGKLAAAVQAAHGAGIVHRDLKPANVLLSAGGQASSIVPGSEGKPNWLSHDPKVADFGLAKVLGDSGQTRTGQVLGSPSYMAPEQARGGKDVGPAADIYALGAILYECLTGRPPFKGVTPLDTLQLVADSVPAPPRSLQPGVPRDLETICLKCLQKPPSRRYSSAADLADDLGRFVEGRPVKARPTPAWERVARWARRSPAQAALVAVSAGALTLAAAAGAWYVETLRLNLELLQYKQQLAERTNELAARLAPLAGAYRAVGDDSQMREIYGEIVEIMRELCRLHPDSAVYRSNLGQSLFNHAKATRSTDKAEAVSLLTEAITELQESLELPWPRNKLGLDRRLYHLRNCYWNRAVAISVQGRYREALPDWDRAVELLHDDKRDEIRLNRAKALARAGEIEQSVAEADALLKAAPKGVNLHFPVAGVYARAARVATQPAQVERYAAEALRLLGEAEKLGVLNQPSVRQGLREADFEVLRDIPAFQKLLGSPATPRPK